MASSDSASSWIIWSIKANIVLNISEIPCYLVKKLWEKTAFDTNNSPRQLNIVSDFHT